MDSGIQVNYKIGAHLLNVYARDAEELEVLLDGLASASPAIASTGESLAAMGVLAGAGMNPQSVQQPAGGPCGRCKNNLSDIKCKECNSPCGPMEEMGKSGKYFAHKCQNGHKVWCNEPKR